MECKDKSAHKAKKDIKKKDIKSRTQTKNNDLKKELKNNENKINCKNKDVGNKIKTSQDKGNDLFKKLGTEDAQEIKCKDNNLGNKIKISQNKESDLTKESENEDTHKIKNKHKNNKRENKIKVSQNEDNGLTEKSVTDTSEIKCKDIQNGTKTSQDENSDLKRKLKYSTPKVEFKDEDNRKRIKTLQNKNSSPKKKLKNKSIRESTNENMEEDHCSDATYLARQIASSERLLEAESKQLYNLCVNLRNEVPPQHEIETRAGSHMPTRKEVELFEKLIPLKKGSYSFEEDKIIASNWKAFCKLHNWDKKKFKPFLQLRIDNWTYMRNSAERRKFVQFLADGLPNRTLYSVYHRFRNLYENNLQRRYKPEEDVMIINHLENNPSLNERRKYSDLAKVLRRTRNSIWRRYRILKKRNEKCDD